MALATSVADGVGAAVPSRWAPASLKTSSAASTASKPLARVVFVATMPAATLSTVGGTLAPPALGACTPPGTACCAWP